MSDSTGKIETIYTFGGVRGNLVLNKATGKSTFYEIKPDGTNGKIYATMTANSFKPENYFTFAHNVANKGNLTVKEFNSKYFYNGDVGRKSIDYNMKSVIKDTLETSNNFSSPEDQKTVQKIAYNNFTWGGDNGTDSIVNSAGERVDKQIPEQFTTVSTNQESGGGDGQIPSQSDGTGTDTNGTGEENKGKSSDFDPKTVTAEEILNETGGVIKVGGERNRYYKYPLNLSERFQANFDFIQLTAYDYQPPGLNTLNNTEYGGGTIGQAWETYQLPMVPGKGETQATSWGRDSANNLQLALAGHASDFMDNPTWENLKNIWGEVVGDFKSVIDDPNTQRAITSWFAGKAVGISGLMRRQTGMVINNNMELLFGGPNLRSFNFSWVLTPRSEDESKQIRAIIKSLKRNAAPQRSVSNLFLKAPRVFKVKYIMGPRTDSESNNDHPYLNTFKTCALTGLRVDYGDGSSNTTYDGGSMTQYTIALTLSELSPIYADEYGTGDDLSTPTTGY